VARLKPGGLQRPWRDTGARPPHYSTPDDVDLKQSLIAAWSGMQLLQQHVIDEAVNSSMDSRAPV